LHGETDIGSRLQASGLRKRRRGKTGERLQADSCARVPGPVVFYYLLPTAFPESLKVSDLEKGIGSPGLDVYREHDVPTAVMPAWCELEEKTWKHVGTRPT